MPTTQDPYILTSSGGRFYFNRPGQEPILPEDIAQPLSKLCRFTGHTRQFYSVAQHSVHVARLVPERFALHALLHDASEAFLGDVSSPLKELLGESYRGLERATSAAIYKRFDLPLELPPEVKHADMVAMATEKRDLMFPDPDPWPCLDGIEADPLPILALSPPIAARMFLDRFYELTCLR
jgi:5'-nucleotidase